MNEQDLEQAAKIYVAMARDIRMLRDMVMVLLVVLVVGACFAVIYYQRHALAAAAAAVKG